MSKPAKAGYYPSMPFVKDEKLTIKANEENGKIVSFEVIIKGKKKTVHVKYHRVLAAFKEVEKLTKNL